MAEAATIRAGTQLGSLHRRHASSEFSKIAQLFLLTSALVRDPSPTPSSMDSSG